MDMLYNYYTACTCSLSDVFFIILAYLFGSISTAILVCKIFSLPDPRTFGSQNPGATNVLRLGNKKAAILTLCGDVLKGFIPVYLCAYMQSHSLILALVAYAAFLGHLYPVFFHFKGGKGVATALGVISALSLKIALMLLITWLVIALGFRLSSLAALLSAFCAPVYFYLFSHQPIYWLLSIAISILLIWRHRTNIDNLLNKNETKINP